MVIFFPGYLKIPDFGVIFLDGVRSAFGMGWNLTPALSLLRRGRSVGGDDGCVKNLSSLQTTCPLSLPRRGLG
jgi:hypothetical protein